MFRTRESMAPRRPSVAGLATFTGLGRGLLAFGIGLSVGVGCANSDAMLERSRRREAIDGNGVACRSGIEEPCYSGAKTTRGRGACKAGRTVCRDDGTLAECTGEVLPAAETCNSVDDDCDGIVDNGFERDGALCFFGGAKGACRTQGKWHCSQDGASSQCDATVVRPVAETCDGVDNDCDGQVDNDSIPAAEATCSTGLAGVCAAGTYQCVTGAKTCIQDIKPGPEICNGKDDNCNNTVDEDCVSEEAAKKQLGG